MVSPEQEGKVSHFVLFILQSWDCLAETWGAKLGFGEDFVAFSRARTGEHRVHHIFLDSGPQRFFVICVIFK